jgi:hypothetical protein
VQVDPKFTSAYPRLVSAREANMSSTAFRLSFQFQLTPLHREWGAAHVWRQAGKRLQRR